MTPQPQGWEERFVEMMPKTSEETMDYGQFCAVRELIRELLAQKEAEKKALVREMVEELREELKWRTGFSEAYKDGRDAGIEIALTTLKATAEKYGITNEQ